MKAQLWILTSFCLHLAEPTRYGFNTRPVRRCVYICPPRLLLADDANNSDDGALQDLVESGEREGGPFGPHTLNPFAGGSFRDAQHAATWKRLNQESVGVFKLPLHGTALHSGRQRALAPVPLDPSPPAWGLEEILLQLSSHAHHHSSGTVFRALAAARQRARAAVPLQTGARPHTIKCHWRCHKPSRGTESFGGPFGPSRRFHKNFKTDDLTSFVHEVESKKMNDIATIKPSEWQSYDNNGGPFGPTPI